MALARTNKEERKIRTEVVSIIIIPDVNESLLIHAIFHLLQTLLLLHPLKNSAKHSKKIKDAI
jgi:hypothetical protein